MMPLDVRRSPYSGSVFNLEVGPHHNYFASRFLVHNKSDEGPWLEDASVAPDAPASGAAEDELDAGVED